MRSTNRGFALVYQGADPGDRPHHRVDRDRLLLPGIDVRRRFFRRPGAAPDSRRIFCERWPLCRRGWLGWTVATALLALAFAVIYYWAPDLKTRCWHWLTPGGALGIVGWLLASLGLRIYLNFYNSFSVTYGSLGAVIILMTWFYITGLMLAGGSRDQRRDRSRGGADAGERTVLVRIRICPGRRPTAGRRRRLA